MHHAELKIKNFILLQCFFLKSSLFITATNRMLRGTQTIVRVEKYNTTIHQAITDK